MGTDFVKEVKTWPKKGNLKEKRRLYTRHEQGSQIAEFQANPALFLLFEIDEGILILGSFGF